MQFLDAAKAGSAKAGRAVKAVTAEARRLKRASFIVLFLVKNSHSD
jgi:hypothetical protein